MILAAILAANIEVNLIGLLQHGKSREPSAAVCGISTVGYRFLGKPGQQFHYAGDVYTLPAGGSIELIASRRRTSYSIQDRSLPLEVWPLDQFGFRQVPLPSPKDDRAVTP